MGIGTLFVIGLVCALFGAGGLYFYGKGGALLFALIGVVPGFFIAVYIEDHIDFDLDGVVGAVIAAAFIAAIVLAAVHSAYTFIVGNWGVY